MIPFVRQALCAVLCIGIAQPSVALANFEPEEDLPPPDTLSDDEKLEWAKKLYKQAKEYHDNQDFYNSVIKYEQAYSYAPDKHIFAYNLGIDAWELKDCARVKQYLQLFVIKDEDNPELVSDAKEILKKADNNPECVTGQGDESPAEPGVTKASGPATDSEEVVLEKRERPGESVDSGEKKKGPSGMLIGGAVLTVLGVGAIGGGIGTFVIARGKANTLVSDADPGPTGFSPNVYNSDTRANEDSLGTLNIVTPVLIGVGSALLATGVALIVVDSINKKKGKGHYASAKKVELTGLGAAPTRGGATASLSLRF
ncbi:MAG: hypothetical protein R3A51_11455 [Nannocystaceae bacterium]